MSTNTRYQTALRATIVNSTVNTLLALTKIIIGYIGHSQALIADGIHSFSDLITDLLVLFAAKLGGQRPDAEHPYGHHRIETLGTILISLVLIGVALGIVFDTIRQIQNSSATTHPGLSVIIVALLSMLANEGLYRYTLKAGNAINSNLLRSNAWHNRSDALVSLIVLVSVLGTWFGLHYLDAVGALVIAALILKMGLTMIWKSGQELIDAGVDETQLDAIRQHIAEVPGVLSLHQLRTRSHGGHIFTDVHIQVEPYISVSEGHAISEHVHLSLIKDFDSIADVTVHIDPEDDEAAHLSSHLPPRPEIETVLKTAWKDLPGYARIQKTVLHYINGKLEIDIVLPLDLLDQISELNSLQQEYQQAIQDTHYIKRINLYYA